MLYCPCGTKKEYDQCCGLFISGNRLPSTPEELMRSRYSAYSQMNMNYLIDTMKSPAADQFDRSETHQRAEKIKWTQLEIIKTEGNALQGFVEFRAHYTINNKKQILHEISEFKFEDGKWYYIDGKWKAS